MLLPTVINKFTRKIPLSIVAIFTALALVGGGTYAFLSDSETSVGNTLAAGELNLELDNTSYYNGQANPNTSWVVGDVVKKFFDFSDVKPADYGEDTISVHVNDNDAWVCSTVKLTSNDDNGINEPEAVDGDVTGGVGQGELANHINFLWWADDGDNVLEQGEQVLPGGPLGVLSVGQSVNVPLNDSQTNIWGSVGTPFPGGETKYIGKAWCFGNIAAAPLPQSAYTGPNANNDGIGLAGTPADGGISCNGDGENNITQTDSLTADISFSAIQSRDNANFICGQTPSPQPSVSPVASASPSPSASPEPGEPFIDQVTSVIIGTFGHCCDVGNLSSNPAVAAALITGAPDSPPDTDFIQISSGTIITTKFVNNKAVDGPGNDIRLYAYDTLFPGTAKVEVTDDVNCLINWKNAGNFLDTANSEINLTPLGLTEARCVRLTDLGGPDLTFPTLGFDLDAIEAINSVLVP